MKRKNFGRTAGICLLALSLAAAVSAYTPGEYTGTAEGFGGDVTVTVTVDENGIKDAQIDAPYEEPVMVEDDDWLFHLTGQVVDAQGGRIDGISGATITSDAVRAALADALAQAEGDGSAAENTEDLSDSVEGISESTKTDTRQAAQELLAEFKETYPILLRGLCDVIICLAACA